MADGSDDPTQVDELARLIERGVVVAAASRYMPGGAQIGAPWLKSQLLAVGRAHAVLVRPGRHPRRDELVQGVRPRVRAARSASSPTPGSSSAIELVAKARRRRLPGGRDPDDLARAHAGRVELQDVEVAAALLPLVLLRIRTESSRRGAIMSKIVVSGSAGFIGGYLVQELLGRGHEVVGIDNLSKYGPVSRSLRRPPELPARRGRLPRRRAHDRAAHRLRPLRRRRRDDRRHLLLPHLRVRPARDQRAHHRVVVRRRDQGLRRRAAAEGHLHELVDGVRVGDRRGRRTRARSARCPPPLSSYGFQKLAVEYFAHAAFDQYGLPYTIVRPFNCVGVGEGRALGDVEVLSGNVKLAMSHVVPDLVQKIVKGQDPLHILGDGTQVRHYTYGGDLARGIAIAIEHPDALNDDFNLSTGQSTTVLELAEMIWKKIRGDDVPFRVRVRRRRSSTTCRSACPPPRRPSACSASRRRRA